MLTVRLPVSGIEVLLWRPTGAEDILLLEADVYDMALALALIERIATCSDEVEWSLLSITDLEALLLRLRQMVMGDAILTDIVCPVEGCGVRVDINFRIKEYLAHHRLRMPKNVEATDRTGWFRLRNTPVAFRLPCGADQVAIATAADPERELIQRCIQPLNISSAFLKRVETAMEAIAPNLSHEVQGQCPECGATVEVFFDVLQFVLSELGNQAKFIYEDVHLLAKHYHWSQQEILALPHSRRTRYTELLHEERSVV